MSDDLFDAGWLALREDADHRSRAHELAARLATTGEARGWSRVLDLGSGTGSNLRYLAPRLPWASAWTLLDHDAELLDRARAPSVPDPERLVGDLAYEGLEVISSVDVVTASALLDLVSEAWLGEAIRACVIGGAGALFALSYDGSIEWRERDAEDPLVREALNAHQRREKGLGRALGPDAALRAQAMFRAEGYSVWLRPSPWVLTGVGDRALTLALVRGWTEAATEVRPSERERLRAWEERRIAAIESGRYEATVGHVDLLALPPGVPG